MSDVYWQNATKDCHPIRNEDENIFKHTKWYQIMVITKDGAVIPNIFYEEGELYQDFDDKIDMTSVDWNVMSVSNDEGSFKIPWIKIDKWCYMENVINIALEYNVKFKGEL